MRANAVYRLFDADGQALYVGLSTRPTARLNDHTHQPWWPDVTRIEVTLHATGEEIARTELAEIERLRPSHNERDCPWRKRTADLIAQADKAAS